MAGCLAGCPPGLLADGPEEKKTVRAYARKTHTHAHTRTQIHTTHTHTHSREQDTHKIYKVAVGRRKAACAGDCRGLVALLITAQKLTLTTRERNSQSANVSGLGDFGKVGFSGGRVSFWAVS